MRGSILIAGLLLFTQAGAADTVKLTEAPMRIGEAAILTNKIDMTYDLTIITPDSPPLTETFLVSNEVERAVEVTQTALGTPSEALVTYTKAIRVEQSFGTTETTTQPVHGNTYLVRFNFDGAPVSTVGPDGETVRDEEKAYVLQDQFLTHARLNGHERTTTTVAIGSDFRVSSSLEPIPGMTIRDSSVLSGVQKTPDGKALVLDVTLRNTSDSGQLTIKSTTTGKILLNQKRGYLYDFTAQGPIIASGSGATAEGVAAQFRGQGVMTVHATTRLR